MDGPNVMGRGGQASLSRVRLRRSGVNGSAEVDGKSESRAESGGTERAVSGRIDIVKGGHVQIHSLENSVPYTDAGLGLEVAGPPAVVAVELGKRTEPRARRQVGRPGRSGPGGPAEVEERAIHIKAAGAAFQIGKSGAQTQGEGRRQVDIKIEVGVEAVGGGEILAAGRQDLRVTGLQDKGTVQRPGFQRRKKQTNDKPDSEILHLKIQHHSRLLKNETEKYFREF